MTILNPNELTFEPTENGFLKLTLNDGTVHNMIECNPLFPLSQPDTYISVSARNNSGVEEIGIIRLLNDLPAKQRALVESEIQFKYFNPEIIDIKKNHFKIWR